MAQKQVVVHKSVYCCINCTSLVVSTCRSQGSTILWVTPNTERGTIESCKSGRVIPGKSVSDSLGTSICGSEVANCEAVSTVSTVSGSELRLGARAVRCDASRLMRAMHVKWAVTVLQSRRSVREIRFGNWGSACKICICRGGDWRSLFVRCDAILSGTHLPTVLRNVGKYLPDYTAPIPGLMVIYFHVCPRFVIRFVLITLVAMKCFRINATVWTVTAQRYLLDDVTSLVECSATLRVRLEGGLDKADMKS